MSDKPVVFISSTSDFAAERRALVERLRVVYEPYIYEEHRPGRRSPLEQLTEQIEKSDVFVAILGGTYGSLFPSADGVERSIVEWEFDTASKRPSLEILPFVRKYPDGTPIDERQRRFLRRVTDFRAHWCKFFDSPADLVTLVRDELEKWLGEYFAEIRRRQHELVPWLHKRLAPIGTGSVLLVLAITLTPLGSALSQVAKIAACVIAAATAATCLVLLQRELGGGDD